MSDTRALALVNEAGIRIGDSAFSVVTVDKWTSFLNERARQLATRLHLVKRRALFSTEANNEAYTYPKNIVQMTRLEFTTTPTDRTTFRDLKEMFEDEWRPATSNSYAAGDPTNYFADQGLLYLYPMPSAVYTRGCRMTYWGLPDAVIDPAIDMHPFAEHVRDVLLAGMMADGYEAIEKYDQSERAEAKYERLIGQTNLRLEDRSDDRRQSIRPRSLVRGYGGQT